MQEFINPFLNPMRRTPNPLNVPEPFTNFCCSSRIQDITGAGPVESTTPSKNPNNLAAGFLFKSSSKYPSNR